MGSLWQSAVEPPAPLTLTTVDNRDSARLRGFWAACREAYGAGAGPTSAEELRQTVGRALRPWRWLSTPRDERTVALLCHEDSTAARAWLLFAAPALPLAAVEQAFVAAAHGALARTAPTPTPHGDHSLAVATLLRDGWALPAAEALGMNLWQPGAIPRRPWAEVTLTAVVLAQLGSPVSAAASGSPR